MNAKILSALAAILVAISACTVSPVREVRPIPTGGECPPNACCVDDYK